MYRPNTGQQWAAKLPERAKPQAKLEELQVSSQSKPNAVKKTSLLKTTKKRTQTSNWLLTVPVGTRFSVYQFMQAVKMSNSDTADGYLQAYVGYLVANDFFYQNQHYSYTRIALPRGTTTHDMPF